jgi:hypothetical protein
LEKVSSIGERSKEMGEVKRREIAQSTEAVIDGDQSKEKGETKGGRSHL